MPREQTCRLSWRDCSLRERGGAGAASAQEKPSLEDAVAAAKAESKGTAVYRGATDTRTAAMVSPHFNVLPSVYSHWHCLCSFRPIFMTSTHSIATAIFILVDVQLSMHRILMAKSEMRASQSEAVKEVSVTILRRRPLRRP